ncbi:baculoviral IAP repeat-containing protein 1-like [Dendropsophus ebraccatus]|uniref:baculoviral IAP repeat-containing protein 1-like n=1 Tax=Dendropsophus ebraccatus TaxID=150705 RepID=UPI003831035C
MASANPNEDEKNEDLIHFTELDIKNVENAFSKCSVGNINIPKYVADRNAKHTAVRQHLGTGYNVQMRWEARRLKSFILGNNLFSWAPLEMAGAGLYFTGVDDSMQCFCCGIVLFCTSLKSPPHKEHLHFNHSCGFIQGKDVGNISKYEVRVQTSQMGQECLQAYSTEEARLGSFTNWPFYARIPPVQLASAGFYFTGRRDIVQCFSCAGCLGHWEENDDPWKEHAKWFPECDFLINKKPPGEIKALINSYNGFHGFTGKHFHTDIIDCSQPCQPSHSRRSIFEDENVRLESFKKWPTDSKGDPAAIARAGFYYTGRRDIVQCFSCAVCLGQWEESDDPWKEHTKWFPDCPFLLKKETNCKDLETHIEETKEVHMKVSSSVIHNEFCPVEVMELRKSLIELYTDPKFRNILPFPGSSHISIDLNSHFADMSVVSKSITNRVLGVLTLPDILTELTDITMIEGEAGSGKTALLRKIAILWASGACPVLSRFSLVFYISLPSTESQQTLSDIIRQQLTGSSTSLTEESLAEMMKQLKNRVLFLLDDYVVMDSLPESIKELIKMNPWNRLSLAITVNPDKGRNLRQYARAILSIQDFAASSSIFIFKHFFSHNLSILERITIQMMTNQTLQFVLKSPLLTFCLCVLWVQDPAETMSGDTLVWKSYVMHVMLRHSTETEIVNAIMGSCEDLAIKSFFKSRFEFTHEDLRESSVNANEALRLKLLSMFTSQRLHPVFKFFHPSFQEFLAGKRMSKLLQSEDAEEKEKGLLFLRNINTISKATGRFFYFLKYTCMHSPETAAIVLSHMLSLLDSSDAFHCQTGEKAHLQHHPELEFMESLIKLGNLNPLLSMGSNKEAVSNIILDKAIAIAEESNFLTHCAPIILSFLKGKTASIVLSMPNMRLLGFLHRFPEGLWSLKKVEIVVVPPNFRLNLDFLNTESFKSLWSVPEVDSDYTNAFELASDMLQKTRMPFLDYFSTNVEDLSTLGFSPDIHRISLLNVKVHGRPVESDNILVNIKFFCSLSMSIDLDLSSCPGFLKSMWPCIDQYKGSIARLSVQSTKLTLEDQELIVHLSALKSLKFVSMAPPDFVLSNIQSFKELKELIVECPIDDKKWEIIAVLSDEFKTLQNIKKIGFKNMSMEGQAGRLANFIENFRNLISFTMKCTYCPGFENIVSSLSRCGQMQELRFQGLGLYDKEIIHLASVLPSFTNLKILEIEFNYSVKAESTKAFAEGLAYLEQLEEFTCPPGPAVKETVTCFIQALQHMTNLRNLSIQCKLLSDSSLLELAKITAEGHLSNLENLDLTNNPDITQSGWRDFFLLLDNLPKLTDLNISRCISQQHITDPGTFIALTHCVSRLHSLKVLSMLGWLLDDKDIEMFDSMKMKHPQSKWFQLFWKWTLPFPPIVTG